MVVGAIRAREGRKRKLSRPVTGGQRRDFIGSVKMMEAATILVEGGV